MIWTIQKHFGPIEGQDISQDQNSNIDIVKTYVVLVTLLSIAGRFPLFAALRLLRPRQCYYVPGQSECLKIWEGKQQ